MCELETKQSDEISELERLESESIQRIHDKALRAKLELEVGFRQWNLDSENKRKKDTKEFNNFMNKLISKAGKGKVFDWSRRKSTL